MYEDATGRPSSQIQPPYSTGKRLDAYATIRAALQGRSRPTPRRFHMDVTLSSIRGQYSIHNEVNSRRLADSSSMEIGRASLCAELVEVGGRRVQSGHMRRILAPALQDRSGLLDPALPFLAMAARRMDALARPEVV